jgi:hypothetical protein
MGRESLRLLVFGWIFVFPIACGLAVLSFYVMQTMSGRYLGTDFNPFILTLTLLLFSVTGWTSSATPFPPTVDDGVGSVVLRIPMDLRMSTSSHGDWCAARPASIMTLSPEGGTMATEAQIPYQYPESRPGSNDRQSFLKGSRIRAAAVDEAIHGPDSRTPEEFARGYQVPLEAVREALDSGARNRPLIGQERDREAARLRARGLLGPAPG